MSVRERFGSRSAVIMAMAGSAIGLGNIWRFPYMVGEHGGAAFVLIYVIATLLVSLPVFIAEMTLGRRSRCSAYGAMEKLRPGHRIWRFAGMLAIFTPLLIDSYYSVIGGWSLEYFFKACAGEFGRMTPVETESIFDTFIAAPWMPVLLHLIFLSICSIIVAFGVKAGIEKFSKISIPVLFFLVVAMIVYSMTLPGAMQGVRYLIYPDFSQLSPKVCAYALGQSFYSLSLGMGAIITYGSYIDKKENLVASGVGTAISDLIFAILAGFAIMPAIFAAGMEPGSGPGLIFKGIPYIFSSIGAASPALGWLFSVVFFLTVVVAAMTSCISLIEVGVSFLIERFGFSRKKSCGIIFAICGTLGIFCSLSFGPLSAFTIKGKGIFDICDWLSSNILLLVLAFLTMLFVGFAMKKEEVRNEITNFGEKKLNAKMFDVIYFLIKWVTPIFIALIFVTNFLI